MQIGISYPNLFVLMDNGYVKISREILSWQWYSDIACRSVAIHLILLANWEDRKWKGLEIRRGQCVTSVIHLSTDLGISVQSIRTALTKLQKAEFLTIKSTNKFSIVTICNYDSYQGENSVTNKQTNNQLTNNQQTTNNNRINKERKNNIILDNNTISQTSVDELGDAQFEQFWSLYDKRVNRTGCYKKWLRISTMDKERILAHVPLYVSARPDKQYRKDPLTYLNQRTWEDEIVSRNQTSVRVGQLLDGREEEKAEIIAKAGF